jgi:hypothetical protein
LLENADEPSGRLRQVVFFPANAIAKAIRIAGTEG